MCDDGSQRRTTDLGEEVTTMAATSGILRIEPNSPVSSQVGGSAFLEMCEALQSPDLLPPTHPDGPRRARPLMVRKVEFGVSPRSVFALAGDERNGSGGVAAS